MAATALASLPTATHEIRLGGIDGIAPTLLKLPAQDFLPTLFADLAQPDWRVRIAARTLATAAGLRLWLPIHQTFQLVLLDAHCLGFGLPRLDPKKFDGMGLVVRRVVVDGDGIEREHGWLRAGGCGDLAQYGCGDLAQSERILGWQSLADVARDPDPKYRPPMRGVPRELQSRLALRAGAAATASESIVPLFVAPPEVCAATGRTLLYGLIPTTSSERADDALPTLNDQDFIAHLSPWLTYCARSPHTTAAPPLPKAGATLNIAEADAAPDDSAITDFLRLLGQLEYELVVFGDLNSSLHALLNEVLVQFANLSRMPLGDWLKLAIDALLRRSIIEPVSPQHITMPREWPTFSADLSQRFANEALRIMQARFEAARTQNLLPTSARFDTPDARYRVRAFVRVKQPGACPPRLVWAKPSDPYTLAPWFDPGDATPALIALPSPADFKKLKPNVSFAVPPSLQAFLQGNDPKKILKGDVRKGGPALDVQWICSFSLPIITLCAFIVLNLFLSLFNVIFSWMAFIKICLPIPRKK